MLKLYSDKKSVAYTASIAMFVYAIISFIAAFLSLIGKKKTKASIFVALSGIAAAFGGITAYTLRIIDRSESKDIDDYFEDYDEDDFDFDEDGNEKSDADTPYVIPVDDTASEEEFNS